MLFYHTLWSYFECVTSITALSGRPGKRKLQDLLNLEAATMARKKFGSKPLPYIAYKSLKFCN